MTTEDNGNVGLLKPTSSSNEDLSEYTDADESISAPTEFLAEFLSAVMLKDYVTALKYCKLILQYEPNNATAKEFYPLILEKLQLQQQQQQFNADEGSDNENESEDEEASEGSSSASGTDSENATSSEESSEAQEEEDEDEVDMGQVDSGGEQGAASGGNGKQSSKGSSDGDATTGSYSSLEDDEGAVAAVTPKTVDQLAALAARYQVDNVDLGNGNKIFGAHLAAAAAFQGRLLSKNANNVATELGNQSFVNANQPLFGTSSDSESPTEPVSQQTVAMLRARVVPNKM